MINPLIEEMFFDNRETLIINSDDVAVLRDYDNLYHAMIMLSNSFTTLPVLDGNGFVLGKIHLGDILNASIVNHKYELERLLDLKIRDILNQENFKQRVSALTADASLEDILSALSHANFACVVDEKKRMVGIITRKEVMSRINRVFHNLGDEYYITSKSLQFSDMFTNEDIDLDKFYDRFTKK